MSLVLNVEILGEFKKLTQATSGAQDSLGDMNKRAQSVSKSISRAFAAIGIGLSFKMIANELKEASKAAIEDSKSQALLANALRNTLDATDDQIAATEEIIRQYQFSAAVADDKLRPAYQKLALATKDTTQANKLLGVALDVAAGTGKDLDVVAQAMARSLAGSDTALLKLIPSLKGSKDPMNDLATAFAGASEKAANLDPYARMKTVFDDLQETVGMALLPILEKFSKWVASPEGQEKLQSFINLVTGLAGKFEVLAGWVIDNGEAFVNMSGFIVAAGLAIKGASVALGIYNGVAAIAAARTAAIAAANVAVGTTATAATGATTRFTVATRAHTAAMAANPILLALLIATGLSGDAPQGEPKPAPKRDDQGRIIPLVPNSPLTTPQPTRPNTGFNFGGATVNNNITINTPKVNAQDIVNTLNTSTRNGYTGTLRSLRE